jgi:hypothetical protein
VPGEYVGQSRLDADADDGELPAVLPLGGELELLVAQLDAGIAIGLILVRAG